MNLQDIYLEIEKELLLIIAEKISLGEVVTDDDVYNWQVSKLLELKDLSKEARELLEKYGGLNSKGIDKLIEDIAKKQVGINNKELKQVKKIIDYRGLKSRIFDMKLQAKDKFNVINSTLLQGVEQVYRDIITKSTAEVIAGLKSLDQAKIDTVKKWIDKGIPTIRDRANRQWSLEAYSKTVIRATTKNTQTAIQEQLFDDNDIDLVEISSHFGSRPSHEPYQGKIYSRSGTSDKYPPLSDTSYGETTGIITGINCRHQMYLFIEGVSIQRYEPYDKKSNADEYKNQQLENRLNREVRKLDTQIEALKKMNASDFEIAKLKTLQSEKKYRLNKLKSRAYNDKSKVLRYNKSIEKIANSMYNLGNTESNVKRYFLDEKLRNKIKFGGFPLTIHEGRQGKHILGHNNYIQGNSYLLDGVDVKKLISKYKGTGLLKRDRHGNWTEKEFVEISENIGIVFKDGNKILSKRFSISYSKKGVHIVPREKEVFK